jgi:RNA polymerase sigma-70 factor (ECF subfamily)
MAAVSELPWEDLHGLASLRDAERLHSWVYRTARNVIVDYYRSPTVRREVASGDQEDLATASAEGQVTGQDDERAALQELAACMMPMIRQLPPAYREAVTLADLEGVNQADAAARAGVSISGMKSRIQRGRKQLKAVFEECCRVELDRRGSIVAFDPRRPDSCGCGRCD